MSLVCKCGNELFHTSTDSNKHYAMCSECKTVYDLLAYVNDNRIEEVEIKNDLKSNTVLFIGSK